MIKKLKLKKHEKLKEQQQLKTGKTKMRDRYISPFTDFGFKKMFGETPNKDLLIDFLNELLKTEEGEIKDLTYLNTEHLGCTDLDRRSFFDLYCTNQRNEKFIVEIQKSKQDFFKDRSVYYSTFPIQEQAHRGKWNFELKRVYTIAILDFVFPDGKDDPDKFLYRVKLADVDTKKIFFDKLTFVYLEMPKFTKTIDELETHFDKWMYILKNLQDLQEIPSKLKDQIFEKLFATAEIAKLNQQQRASYESSLKHYRDSQNTLDTSFREGLEQGIEKGMEKGIEKGMEKGVKETAIRMKKAGMKTEAIAMVTFLTKQEIDDLI